jgi:hypothetical protein
MGLPWRLALSAIPWARILANAPVIARSADALLRGTGAARAGDRDAEHVRLAARVDALERTERETAELLNQASAQLAAITTAAEVLQARVQWLLAGVCAALVAAVAALVAAFAMR